jgi:hypothetical protein
MLLYLVVSVTWQGNLLRQRRGRRSRGEVRGRRSSGEAYVLRRYVRYIYILRTFGRTPEYGRYMVHLNGL